VTMEATPTRNNLPLRTGDFSTLAEALNYAAQGQTGYNFYDGRCKLSAVLPFSKLRDEAEALARRLSSLGLERGARMALVADTHPDFIRFFFACQPETNKLCHYCTVRLRPGQPIPRHCRRPN